METILLHVEDHVATITINRANTLNALSTQVLTELNQALDQVHGNKEVYVLVIASAGEKAFVAGADIAEMKDKTVEEAAKYGKFGNDIFSKIETFRCPVIAAIQGYALGGGCELAMSCDIRIASENAIFGQPEVGLGIIPGFGGTQRLARICGVTVAKELIFGARHIKADRAYQIGLVNQVVSAEELMPATLKMANDIAKNAPIAVAYAKQAINEGLQTDLQSGIQIEIQKFSACFATEDQTYGMACFLENIRKKTFSNQ